jgi:hypothetical protein
MHLGNAFDRHRWCGDLLSNPAPTCHTQPGVTASLHTRPPSAALGIWGASMLDWCGQQADYSARSQVLPASYGEASTSAGPVAGYTWAVLPQADEGRAYMVPAGQNELPMMVLVVEGAMDESDRQRLPTSSHAVTGSRQWELLSGAVQLMRAPAAGARRSTLANRCDQRALTLPACRSRYGSTSEHRRYLATICPKSARAATASRRDRPPV